MMKWIDIYGMIYNIVSGRATIEKYRMNQDGFAACRASGQRQRK